MQVSYNVNLGVPAEDVGGGVNRYCCNALENEEGRLFLQEDDEAETERGARSTHLPHVWVSVTFATFRLLSLLDDLQLIFVRPLEGEVEGSDDVVEIKEAEAKMPPRSSPNFIRSLVTSRVYGNRGPAPPQVVSCSVRG